MKELYKKISQNRYKEIGGYKLDRWLFQLAMWLIFGWLFFVAYYHNFNLDYFNCPVDSDGSISGAKIMLKDFTVAENNVKEGLCRNPFYKASWKNQEYLPPGEYGTKPGKLFYSAQWVSIGLIVLALLLNHFIYNRGFKFNDDDINKGTEL